MDKKSVAKNYRFLAILLSCMVAGALLGWFRPKWGHNIAFLGTVFINMMFCVVVPLVFASIAGSVANMESRQRAGKIMGVTVGTFVITGAIAAVLMFVLMKLFPPVLTPWADMVAEEIGEHASFTEMIVNFFTSSDFVGLLSRRAMLPLIVFSILFGFSVQMTGGKDSSIGKWLAGLSDVMMKFVQIITYYAPIAFFAIFADLVATYGSEVAKGYGRALLVYYPCASSISSQPSPCSRGSAAARVPWASCSSTLPALPLFLWAPALPWQPSPPTWRKPWRPVSARISPVWCCPWALPCTWMAPASPAC